MFKASSRGMQVVVPEKSIKLLGDDEPFDVPASSAQVQVVKAILLLMWSVCPYHASVWALRVRSCSADAA